MIPTWGAPTRGLWPTELRGNRSLSLGDVLAVNDAFFACQRGGWTELDKPPRIELWHQPGTTPLY